MENQKHFAIIDPNASKELLKRVEPLLVPKTQTLLLAKPPCFQSPFVVLQLLDESGDVSGGTLYIPERAVLMLGTNYSSKLGFHCMEAADS